MAGPKDRGLIPLPGKLKRKGSGLAAVIFLVVFAVLVIGLWRFVP